MTVLTEGVRDKLAKSKFGEPGERKYPMPDREHAANAKSRAKEELDKGKLSREMYDHIIRMANHILGEK